MPLRLHILVCCSRSIICFVRLTNMMQIVFFSTLQFQKETFFENDPYRIDIQVCLLAFIPENISINRLQYELSWLLHYICMDSSTFIRSKPFVEITLNVSGFWFLTISCPFTKRTIMIPVIHPIPMLLF